MGLSQSWHLMQTNERSGRVSIKSLMNERINKKDVWITQSQ